MKFLGEEVAKGNKDDLTKIVDLLRSNLVTNSVAKDRYSWVMFDWDTPSYQMVASTMYGILKEPKSVAHRYYAQMAAKEPWKLNFDSADIGISSGEWIIPAGMGITNKNGEFIGMLSMGFNVAKFSQKIDQVIDGKHVSFLVLDDKYKVALHSPDSLSTKLQGNTFKDKLEKNILPAGAGFLPQSIKYGDIVYSYYNKMDGYPFIILVGYSQAFARQDFYETLLPGILGFTIVGLAVLALLFTLRHLLVKPIIHLSTAVDKMAAGESIDVIDGCNTYETNNLAEQLLRVNSLIKADKESRAKLEEAIQIAKDADIEKEKFLSNMYRALQTPLLAIKNGADFARHASQDTLTNEEYKRYFDGMFEAADQLLTYTTNVIYPSETNIAEVVEKCITIQKKSAADSKLTLTADIEENIPPLWVDKLRIQQVLLSTIHESMLFTPPTDGIVHVSAKVEKSKDQTPGFLILQVQDNGTGFDEARRSEFVEMNRKHRPEFCHDPDASSLTLHIIKHLVKLHYGTFKMEARRTHGTTFTIRLPYLTKDQLPNTGNLAKFGDYPKKTNANNVIAFPQKIMDGSE
jgi:signal transduction histidine kinase